MEEEEIVAAARRIECALYMEELFSYTTDNLLDLDVELLSIAAKEAKSINTGHDDLHRASRRLVNYMSTSRMYLDQLPKLLKRAEFPDFGVTEFKQATAAAYDSGYSYAFIEELRNYAQHESLPADRITVGGRWLRHSQPEQVCLHRATLTVRVSSIQKSFKRLVLERLTQADLVDVDIPASVQAHWGGLSSVHAAVRRGYALSIEGAIGVTESEIDSLDTPKNHIIKLKDGTFLNLEALRFMNKRRSELVERYPGLPNAKAHAVSSIDAKIILGST